MNQFERTRDSLAIYTLARGTNDTVLAGGGLVGLRFSPRSFPVFYGQVFRVAALDRAGDLAIRRVLDARRSPEIVIVPWGYGLACRIRDFLRTNPHILTTFPGNAIAQGWER